MMIATVNLLVERPLEESLRVLRSRVEALDASVKLYSPASAGENGALVLCDHSRSIWDNVEGLLHRDIQIPQELLLAAIRVIDEAIPLISTTKLPIEASPEVVAHIPRIIIAMTERRDDLETLRSNGKYAFFGRLRERQ